MAKCQTCGADLPDASQRFCGDDRCQRVFMRPSWAADDPRRWSNPAAGSVRRTKKSYFDNQRGVT
jgi:hypothetical protein